MQGKAMIHPGEQPPGSLARLLGVDDGGNVFVIHRQSPDVEFLDQSPLAAGRSRHHISTDPRVLSGERKLPNIIRDLRAFPSNR